MSKIKILLIFLIGLSLPLYVLWGVISVDFDYSSIGEPQSGVKINFQKINDKKIIIFPEEENYLFDQIELKTHFNKESELEKEIRIKAYKNFLATFYPKQETILNQKDVEQLLNSNNDTDLPVGSLFYNGDSVSILLPGNSYQSFFSAELFEKMGYQWEDVIEKPVGFASELEEKEVFNFGKAHPSGTVFETPGGFYLVWEEQIFPLNEAINIDNLIKINPVKIDSIEPESFGDCLSKIENDEANCHFEKNFNTQKSDYIFEIEGFQKSDIERVDLNLSASPSKWSLQNNFLVSVENIKLKLIKKYRGYIPFI